jgi:hypothetical protein
MGDVLKIEGDRWTMTGNPSFAGKVSSEGGKVKLVLEKVGDQSRAEAIATPGAQRVKERLESLDEQLVFEVVEQDGKTQLKQVGKGKVFAEWRFVRNED